MPKNSKMMNLNNSLFKEPYHIINLSFTGIIVLVFVYSGIFSAQKCNYPIQSACINKSQNSCPSRGLSRSFSEIVRFNFNNALKYNKHGIKVFSFFFIQLFLRILASFLLFKKINKRPLIITDSILSVVLYIYCFNEIII